jgi:hypothetical protein
MEVNKYAYIVTDDIDPSSNKAKIAKAKSLRRMLIKNKGSSVALHFKNRKTLTFSRLPMSWKDRVS